MSWDLDEAEARELAQEYIDAMEPPRDDEWVITTVREEEWGWIISWVNIQSSSSSSSPVFQPTEITIRPPSLPYVTP